MISSGSMKKVQSGHTVILLFSFFWEILLHIFWSVSTCFIFHSTEIKNGDISVHEICDFMITDDPSKQVQDCTAIIV